MPFELRTTERGKDGMANHEARFPGKINNPDADKLSDRQATRLAAISKLPVAELKGKTPADLR